MDLLFLKNFGKSKAHEERPNEPIQGPFMQVQAKPRAREWGMYLGAGRTILHAMVHICSQKLNFKHIYDSLLSSSQPLRNQ